ncbi:MAG: LamG-like jellyroll fold domain-containing protein, partial [Gaiellaceae bacterium]
MSRTLAGATTGSRRQRLRVRSVARFALLALVLAVATLTVGAARSPAVGLSYSQEVLADTPAAYWRFGEAVATTAAVDQSGNGNTGTYLQAVTLGVPGALATDANTAARFDGGSGRMSVTDPASGILDFGTGDFSLEAWVKTSVNGERALISKRDATRYWQVTVTDDGSHIGQLRANIFDGSVTREVYSLHRVDDGSWHHVAVLFDRDSGIRFYVDGINSGFTLAPATGDLGNAAPLMVAKSSGYANLNGDVDEVAVYRTLLPVDRVRAHYYAALNDLTAPTVSLSTPADGSTTGTTPSFSGLGGTALGDLNAVTVNVYAGAAASGTPVQERAAGLAEDGSYSVDASPALAAGTYTAQTEQEDGRGNMGLSAARTFTVVEDAPPPPPPPPSDPVLVGAGDIASCGVSGQDEATASIIEGLPNASVFTTGDNAYPNGTPAEYQCYDASWGRFKSRTRPVPGGHDYLTPDAEGYYGYFGAAAGNPAEGWYSYDLGDWHIVALNTYCAEIPGGSCDNDAQEAWLRADLAANPGDCTMAYFHIPQFSSGNVHGSTESVRPLWEVLYEYGADLIVNGNEHLYERFAPQTPTGELDTTYGIPQITVGTGGYVLYGFTTPEPNSLARINDAHGVLKLVLHNGSFDWQFLPIPGATSTDSGTANCHG